VSAATVPPPGAPVKTPKQATVDFFATRLAGMPDLKVTVEAEVITADKVAGSFVYSDTHGGTYLGIAPTGRPLRFTSCRENSTDGTAFWVCSQYPECAGRRPVKTK